MSTNKILHVFNDQKKFSKSYFEFLLNNGIELSKHNLFHYGNDDKSYSAFNIPYTFSGLYSIPKHLKLLKLLHSVDKVIVHSLASPWLLLYLYLFPTLNQKVYWVIWGKDLYFYKLLENKCFYHEIYEFFRKRVFRKVGHIVTYIKGDYELAKKWYGISGKYHECIMYPSNLYKEYDLILNKHKTIHIQIGNSADPSNNHLEVFERIKPFREKDIKIFVPLSYEDQKYAKRVIKAGKEIFGDKFIPLTKFMPFEEYLDYLSTIDIAIFNHKRQQGMGNIINLLGQGKKIYLRSDITTWDMFTSINIKVFDVRNIELELLDKRQRTNNQKLIQHMFSKENLFKQWNEIFKENA